MSFLLGDDCYFDEQLQPGDKICLIAKIDYMEFNYGGYYLSNIVELAYNPK